MGGDVEGIPFFWTHLPIGEILSALEFAKNYELLRDSPRIKARIVGKGLIDPVFFSFVIHDTKYGALPKPICSCFHHIPRVTSSEPLTRSTGLHFSFLERTCSASRFLSVARMVT